MIRAIKALCVVALLMLSVPALAANYAFESAGTISTGTGSITGGTPGTWNTGSTTLMFTSVRSTGETITTPTGWTDVVHRDGDGFALFCRIKQGGDTIPAIDWSGSGTSTVQVASFSGGFGSCTSIIETSNLQATTSVAGFPYKALTIANNNEMVLIIGKKNKTATSNGATINDEPNFTEIGESGPAGTSQFFVWNYWIQTTKTNLTASDWDFTGTTETANVASYAIAFNPPASPPTLSSVSVTAQTSTAYTVSYTTNQSTTVYYVAYSAAASAPTCTQIKAGQNSSGASAITSGSKSSNGADTQTVTPGESPNRPIYDISLCAADAGGDSSVTTLSDQALNAPASYQFVTITSIGTGSPCASFNAATNPDIANGDILKAPTTTSPGSYSLTIGADCQFSYTGDGTRQSALNIAVYDTSVGAYHSDDIDFWSNNLAPNCDAPTLLGPYKINSDSVSYDFSAVCVDPEGDALTCAKASGTYSPGLSLGSCVLSGTPTTENESGDFSTTTVTDIAGATGSQDLTIYPINTITAPNCTSSHLDLGSCIGALQAALLDLGSLTLVCDPVVDSGSVISQTPSAGAEVDTPWTVDLTISRGTCRALRNRIGIEHSISLH